MDPPRAGPGRRPCAGHGPGGRGGRSRAGRPHAQGAGHGGVRGRHDDVAAAPPLEHGRIRDHLDVLERGDDGGHVRPHRRQVRPAAHVEHVQPAGGEDPRGGAGRVQAGEARRGDVAGARQVRGVRGEDVADDQVAAGRVGRGQDLGGVGHADAQGRGAGQAEALTREGGQAGVDLHRGLVGARVRVVHPAGERAARAAQVQGPQGRGLRPVRPDGRGGPAHVLEGHALGALGVQRRGLDAVDVEDERARLEGVLADLGGAVGDRVDARLDPGGAGGSARGPAPARRRPAAHAAPPSCGRRRTISCSCRPAHGPVIGSGAPTDAKPCLA